MLRDGRGRPARGRRSGPGLPRRARRRPPPGSVVAADAGGQPAAPRRGPGAGRARPATGRRAARRSGSTRTASPCSSRSSAGAPGSASAPTTSTRTSPAGSPSTSPGSTCRWPSPSPRRCATGRSRPGTVAIGEVGLLGELRAVAGLERRLREAARLGFARALVPRGRGPRRRRSRGSRSSAVATRARRARRGARRPPATEPRPREPATARGLTASAGRC